MNDIAIRTINLGKMYRIGEERLPYQTLRESFVRFAKRPIERIRHPGATTDASADLWALRHIDLEVQRGEVLGVIGRNGAGKSTLLKVLSHITDPSEGRVEIRGRVGSLLEVGTGFHPELTGRENIQLSGAIIGMTRSELKSKFDDIVEFSELSRFLDTPVKRYSSGMYVRLAFAVAAHLTTEVLIVDEVLAVGDMEFQKKCLGMMGQVATGGRTVLFVSHNMSAIRALCTRCARLSSGELAEVGDVEEAIEQYISSGGSSGTLFGMPDSGIPKTGPLEILSAELRQLSLDDQSKTSIEVNLHCRAVEELFFNLEWRVATARGDPIAFGSPEQFRGERLRVASGVHDVLLSVKRLPLAAGDYRLEIVATQARQRTLDRVHVPFSVENCDPDSTGFNFRLHHNWAPTFAEDEVTVLGHKPVW